jgi:hypothetical protein
MLMLKEISVMMLVVKPERTQATLVVKETFQFN